MKKVVLIIIAVALALCTFALAACPSDDSDENRERITLTKNNYSEYILITVSFEDYQTRLESPVSGYNKYISTATAKVTAARKGNYNFEGVKIDFSLSISPFRKTRSAGTITKGTLEISYDGTGASSMQVESTLSTRYPTLPAITSSTFSISGNSAVKGVVLI